LAGGVKGCQPGSSGRLVRGDQLQCPLESNPLLQSAALLEETLAEEKEADKKLTSISKQVNSAAKQAA
jgi:hypothetical protein